MTATLTCMAHKVETDDCFSVFWFRVLMTSDSRTMVWLDKYIEIPCGLGYLTFQVVVMLIHCLLLLLLFLVWLCLVHVC